MSLFDTHPIVALVKYTASARSRVDAIDRCNRCRVFVFAALVILIGQAGVIRLLQISYAR